MNRWKLPWQNRMGVGRHDNGEMLQMRPTGTRQNWEISLEVTPFLLYKETHFHPPSSCFFWPRLNLSIRKTEKFIRPAVTAVSGDPDGVSHVSVKQKMFAVPNVPLGN